MSDEKPLELITKERPYILNQLDDLEQEMIRLRMIEKLATNVVYDPSLNLSYVTDTWKELETFLKGEN